MEQHEEAALKASIDLAARREARRKKILENSNNRLGKLTGREHNEPPLISENAKSEVLYPDPELEQDSSAETAPGNLFSLFSETTSGGSAGGTLFNLFLRTKVQFRFLGALCYILFATGSFNMTSFSSIIIPVLCWEVVEVFVLKTYVPKVTILSVVFSFLGMPPNRVAIATKILETSAKISKDMALFIQSFIVTHFAYCKLWLRLDFQTIFFAGVMGNQKEEAMGGF